MVGRQILELIVAPESLDEMRHRIRSGSGEPCEAVLRRKDGTTLVAELHGKTVSYKGRPVRVVSRTRRFHR